MAAGEWIPFDVADQWAGPAVETTNDRSPWADVRGAIGRDIAAMGAGTRAAFSDDEDAARAAATAAYESQALRARAAQGGIPSSLGDVQDVGGLAKYLGAGALQSTPYLAIGGAGMLGGPAGMGAALAAGTAAHGGQNIAEALNREGTADVGKAYGWAVPQAALDVAGSGLLLKGGLSGAAGRGVEALGGGWKSKALAGALTEGAEQAGIGAAGTFTQGQAQGYTPTGRDYLEGAVVGAAMGAPAGAFHGGIARRAAELTTTPIADKTVGSTDISQLATAQSLDIPTWQRRGGGDIYAYDEAGRQGGQYSLPLREPAQAGRRPMDVGQGPLPAQRELSGQQMDLFQPQQQGLDLAGGEGHATPYDAYARAGEAAGGPISPAGGDFGAGQGALDFNAPQRRRLFNDQDAIAALQGIDQQAANAGPQRPLAMPGQMPAPNPAAQLAMPPRRPAPMPAMPPRVREMMARAAANEPGRVAVPPERNPFRLTGQTPEQLRALSRAAEAEANRLELKSPESHAGQHELDLGEPANEPAKPVPQPGQAELFAPTQGGQKPFQDVLRDAYKQHAGNMQGIQAFAKILQAKDAETAAAMIRDKANDSSATSFAKLDAIHKALTGESLEQHAARTVAEGAGHAVETGKEQGGGKPERRGNDEQRVSAEGGGGGKPEQRPQEQRTKPAEAAGKAEDHAAAEGGKGEGAEVSDGAHARGAQNIAERFGIKNAKEMREEARRNPELRKALRELTDEGMARTSAAHGEVKLPERGEETPAHGMDAITMAREQAAEHRPGLLRMVKDIEKQLGLPGETPKQRRERIETLSHIAHLERDTAAVTRAREALDDMTTDEERERALKATAEEAATRTNQDVRGEFRKLPDKSEGAHDREVFSMVGDGAKAHDVLAHIAENHPDERIRELAQHMLDNEKLEGVTIRHGTEAERRAAPEHAVGEARGNEVLLHSIRDAAQTVLHELVHTATVKALNAGGAHALEMRRLYAEAQKVEGLAKEYGLENVKEFVAEAFSNPAFREALDKVKAPTGTLWERIKGAIAKLLGVKDKSLLDAVMETREGLRGEAATARSDGSPKALYRQATEGGASGRGHAASDGLRAMYRDAEGAGKSAKELAQRINIATMPTHIIAKTYDHILKKIEPLTTLMDQRKDSIGERQRKVIDVATKIEAARKAAGKIHLDRLHQVIGDTQVAGVHPAKAGELEALRTKRDAAVAAARKADDSLEGLRAKDAARTATAAYNAREQWEAMTKEERTALDAGFDSLEASQHDRYNVLKRIVGEKDSPFFQFRGPYAPLKRYGDYIVSVKSKAMQEAETALIEAQKTGDGQAVKDARERLALMNRDPDHRSVFAVENMREAEEKAAQLRGAVGDDAQVHTFTRDNFFKQDTGHRDPLVSDIMARLDDEFGGSPDLAALKAMVMDSYVERMPDGSAASMSAHRQLVQGWSQDFSRVIVDRLGRDAFQIGTMEYAKQMSDAMKALDNERREVGTAKASDVYNALVGRLAHESDYSKFRKAERMIAEATHVFYLGASPAFMLMNMLQTPMLAVPVMAGKFGFGRGMGAAMRAMQDVWRLFDRDTGLKVSDAKHLTDEEKFMIGRMENLGLIDLTSAHTSARMARGERIIDPKTGREKVIAGGQKLKEMLNIPVQYIESVNRGGTALAAYRLAREGGVRGRGGAKMEHEAAMRYAADVLRDSHVDYGAEANSTLFRIPGGRVLFQFQKYGLTMFHMLSRTMFDAYGHPKEVGDLRRQLLNKNLPDEKRADVQGRLDTLLERRTEARRALTGIMAMHQLMVGAMGLPFAGLGFGAADVLRSWMGDPEDQPDTRVDFQNYLANAFGTDAATVIARGIPAALLGVDISRRVGLGDVAPGTQTLTNITRSRAAGGGATDLFERQLVSLLGPAGGIGKQFAQGMDKMGNGQYVEGAFTMMPRAIFNASEGIRMGGEGVQVAGKKVHEPLNSSDAFIQFLGLPSTEVERTKEAAYSARALTGRASLVRNRLIAQAAEARTAGEPMPDGVAEFNQRNPDLRITVGDVIKHQRKEAGGGTVKPAKPGSVSAGLAKRATAQKAYATDEE